MTQDITFSSPLNHYLFDLMIKSNLTVSNHNATPEGIGTIALFERTLLVN